jgi:4'-phosphopantetheinyl transferase
MMSKQPVRHPRQHPDITPSPPRHRGADGGADCDVWVAELTERRPALDALLDQVERSRADAFLRPEDRSRFVIGAALLKLAVAHRSGLPAGSVSVDRRCGDCGGPHGRPLVPGSDLDVSVAHSGSRVAVAVSSVGAVGVDIEHRAAGRLLPAAEQVLTGSEPLSRPEDFLTYWCRKESVVKATGDGLRISLRKVVVSAPGQPARLMSYCGRDLPAFMIDLEAGHEYAAAVTILSSLSSDRVTVDLRPAESLLGE